MKRITWWMPLLGMVAAMLLLTSSREVRADTVWTARYWNNKTLSGTPVLQRNESGLLNDWGEGSPDPLVNSDSFSARWEGNLSATAGTYRFTATMDDGMRVWVDGVLIIDSWWDSQVHSMSADRYLTEGNHGVKVEYYQAGGRAVAKLVWEWIGGGSTTIQNWRGEYFNNTSLAGNPVLVRDDLNLDFDWGTGSPLGNVVNSDQFSVRWTRNVGFNAGRYRFQATVDDGVRLWVNNVLIIDQWHQAPPTPYTAEIELPGGTLPVKMEYYEGGGGAVARLGWTQISGATFSNWRGEYYSNKFLAGSPVFQRDDSQVDFNWGYGSPGGGIGSDDFAVRWTRNLSLSAGRYRFTLTSDDGARLWVNSQLIIDKWYDRAVQSFNAEIDLPGSAVPVKVEYYENTQQAEVHLSWARVDGTQPPAGGPYSARVTANRLNVRQGPGVGYTVITTINRDTMVTLTHRNGDASWVRVILPNSTQGWVSATYLSGELKPFTFLPQSDTTAPPPAPPPTGAATATVVNAYFVNVRQGPGTSYGIITHVGRNAVVELAGYRNSNASWVKVRLASGTLGWMSSYYLRTSYPLTNLTVGGW